MVDFYPSLGQCSVSLAGHLMMLPQKDSIQNQILASLDIEDGIFNHPVVVLSTSPVSGIISFLVVGCLSRLWSIVTDGP